MDGEDNLLMPCSASARLDGLNMIRMMFPSTESDVLNKCAMECLMDGCTVVGSPRKTIMSKVKHIYMLYIHISTFLHRLHLRDSHV